MGDVWSDGWMDGRRSEGDWDGQGTSMDRKGGMMKEIGRLYMTKQEEGCGKDVLGGKEET